MGAHRGQKVSEVLSLSSPLYSLAKGPPAELGVRLAACKPQ